MVKLSCEAPPFTPVSDTETSFTATPGTTAGSVEKVTVGALAGPLVGLATGANAVVEVAWSRNPSQFDPPVRARIASRSSTSVCRTGVLADSVYDARSDPAAVASANSIVPLPEYPRTANVPLGAAVVAVVVKVNRA